MNVYLLILFSMFILFFIFIIMGLAVSTPSKTLTETHFKFQMRKISNEDEKKAIHYHDVHLHWAFWWKRFFRWYAWDAKVRFRSALCLVYLVLFFVKFIHSILLALSKSRYLSKFKHDKKWANVQETFQSHRTFKEKEFYSFEISKSMHRRRQQRSVPPVNKRRNEIIISDFTNFSCSGTCLVQFVRVDEDRLQSKIVFEKKVKECQVLDLDSGLEFSTLIQV